ncbi:hypothetical protein GJ496_005045 [Pomphorhynchus laevis]|nr:hypothetical protein GJ496_005045 [Pomphorhynchus laevis]
MCEKKNNSVEGGRENGRAAITHNQDDSNYLEKSTQSLQAFIDKLIHPDRYDKRIRPFMQHKVPCNVTMTVHINSISAINEVTMDYNIDLYFRQIWIDPRLRYDHTNHAVDSPIVLHYDLIDRIWMPDSYFRNAKEGKRSDITVPNRLTRIYKDGQVLYSQRLLLKLDCPMKLQKFPLDNQTCLINIGSYGYTLDDIQFEWSTTESPVGISSIEMPDFLMEQYQTVRCERITSTGSYSCLEIKLYLKRLFGYYFVQVLPIRSGQNFDGSHECCSSCYTKLRYSRAITTPLLEYVLVNVLAWRAEQRRQQTFFNEKQHRSKTIKSGGIVQIFKNGNLSCDKIVGTKLATSHSPLNRQKVTKSTLPNSSTTETELQLTVNSKIPQYLSNQNSSGKIKKLSSDLGKTNTATALTMQNRDQAAHVDKISAFEQSILEFLNETKKDKLLNFLDVTLLRKHFEMAVFMKPTHDGTCLNYKRVCPHIYKIGVIKTLLYRAFSVCSDTGGLEIEIERIRQLLNRQHFK